MPWLEYVCNCSCCEGLFRCCSKLCRRKVTPEHITASELFSREGLASARPSIILPFGGKYESLDYEHSENSLFILEQTDKGLKNVSKLLFLRGLLLVLIGFVTGLICSVTDYGTNVVNCYKNAYFRKIFNEDMEHGTYDIFIWSSLINGGLALLGSAVVVFVEPAATGGGIAGVLGFLNGVKVPKAVEVKVLIVKVVSFFLMSISGLPGGKEGPLIHIGAIVGAALPLCRIPFTGIRIFPNFVIDTERRDFAVAGVAAGLAGAFATPLSSMLMSVEEYISFWSGDLIFRIFLCSLISTSTLTFFISCINDSAGIISSKELLFLHSLHQSKLDKYSLMELPLFILIGVLGGLLGSLWIYIHKFMAVFRRRCLKFKFLQVLEVTFWAVSVNTIYILLLMKLKYCSPLPRTDHNISNYCTAQTLESDVKMNCRDDQMALFASFTFQGNNNLFDLFMTYDREMYNLESMTIMFTAYFLLSGFFSGSMISAGVFIPNMISGAAFGRCIASVANRIIGPKNLYWADPTRCAFFGSAALLSGVVRLTFSLAVLYCEGASNTILFFPVVMVLLAVKAIADLIVGGIYDEQAKMASIPLLSRYPPPVAIGLTASDVMSRYNVVFLTTLTTVRRLIQVSFETRHNGFPVVDTKYTSRENQTWPASIGRLEGIILRSQLLILLKNQWFDNPQSADVAKRRISAFRRDFAELLSRRAVDTKPGMNIDSAVNLEAFMDPAPFSVKGNTSLNRTYRIFTGIGLRHLCVVNNSNEVIGMITRKDLAKYKTQLNVSGVHVHINNYLDFQR